MAPLRLCAAVTSAQANAQVRSLVEDALREHERDPQVQRAAQRLNDLLYTMDTSAGGLDDYR